MPLKNLFACGADHGRQEREKAFLENGGLVLEKLVASCNGRPIPIRTFSYEELISATNNFDPQLVLYTDTSFKFYKGFFEGRSLSIKSYFGDGDFPKKLALTDLSMSAKLSGHKNILRLIGCCLETPNPTLVYENAQNGNLVDQIFVTEQGGTPMLWRCRLNIAGQIAHAIAYIHTAFSRPIVLRHIKTNIIFLDQNDIPKLSDFAICITIPEGEIDVEDDVIGAFGFICPRYFATSKASEKTDVYSFGVVLLELLTGQRASRHKVQEDDDWLGLVYFSRNNAMNEILDPAIMAEEGGAGVQQQLEAVLQLALGCTELDPEKRPTMVDVVKELRRIERSIT